jgi:hypothetical protein
MFSLNNIIVFVIVDTDGKIIAVVVDTGGQFAAATAISINLFGKV